MKIEGKRIAALSDMLELGEEEKAYHYAVGKYIAGKNIDEVIVFGELSREILRGIEENLASEVGEKKEQNSSSPKITLLHVDTREEMIQWLLSHVQPEDAVLLKASNGMKLSEVSKALQAAKKEV